MCINIIVTLFCDSTIVLVNFRIKICGDNAIHALLFTKMVMFEFKTNGNIQDAIEI